MNPLRTAIGVTLSVAVIAVGSTAGIDDGSRAAHGAEAVLRIVVVLPTGAPDAGLAAETSAGVALAIAASNDLKAAGAKRPLAESVDVIVADGAAAGAAVDDAAKRKVAGIVALATEAIAADLEAAARRTKSPLVEVGPGTPSRTMDPADPVLRVEASAAEQAFALGELLRLRCGKSSIGLPAETKKAWLVIEDASWSQAVAASLRAMDTAGLVTAGAAVVKRGAAIGAADVSKARTAGIDRVVVIGSGELLRTTRAALDGASWGVAVLATDAAFDSAAPSGPLGQKRSVAVVGATPSWTLERHLDDIVAKHPPAAGRPAKLTPASIRAFVAASALIDAATAPAAKRGVLGGMRDIVEGSGGKQAPLFDGTGSVDRWKWSTWLAGADGTMAPANAAYLPDAGIGPLLGGKLGARFRAAPGALCVRIGFGGSGTTADVARTIDADLATLGLFSGGAGGPVDELVRDAIVARTCAKLSRVFLRNADGSERAALSYKIAFVPENAATTGASAVWDDVIAGDGPDGLHGGQAFPKLLRAQALSTYLLRNAPLLHQAKLAPPLAATDIPYLDGTYPWATSAEGNSRCDKLRALIDGVASTYCMKSSKEVGHLAGLSIDGSGDPRSVMVTKGGEGVGDEFAYFPPAFTKVLERTLGRVGAEGK